MHRMQHCMQTGAYVKCAWVMVKVLCQMLSDAEWCDLTGQKLVIVRRQLTCYSRWDTLLACHSVQKKNHIDLHRLSVMSLDLLCRSTNKLVMLSWMRKNWILVMRRLRENYGNLISPVYLFWVCLPNMILLAKYSFILHNDDKQLHTGQLLQVSL